MLTDIYNLVVQILGQVPTEIDYVYPIATLIMFGIIMLAFITPFYILILLAKR